MIYNLAVNGFEMQYIRFGTGEKTLVILPGLSVQSVMSAAPLIEKQYKLFCGDYTVYLFDRRSDLPAQYTVYDMAGDTAAAIKALGLNGICLYGVSQGGMLAMLIAYEYPALVSKLALASTACRFDGKRAAAVEEWVSLAKEGNAEKLYLSFGEKLYSKEVFEQYKNVLKDMAKTVTENDLKRFITVAEGTAGFDATNRISAVKCPVLAIGDTADNVLGADSTPELARAFKDNPLFESYMYSGYGHAVYDAAPDFTKRLYDFFYQTGDNYGF